MTPELLHVFASWVADIWNPDRAPKGRRLFYRTRGIVLFDRVLNGEIERHQQGMQEPRNG